MQKSKIDWIKNGDGSQGNSWNPVIGCYHGCPYCYANKFCTRFRNKPIKKSKRELNKLPNIDGLIIHSMTYKNKIVPCYEIENGHKVLYPFGFRPTFFHTKLEEPKKLVKRTTIFVVSMGDLFGEWVPSKWIRNILEIVKQTPQHLYIFLTKNCSRYFEFHFPNNCWLGQTIDGTENKDKLFYHFKFIKKGGSFINFEPLLGGLENSICQNLSNLINFVMPDWIIIGAQTNPFKRVIKAHLEEIYNICMKNNIPLFMKNSIRGDAKKYLTEFKQEIPYLN